MTNTELSPKNNSQIRNKTQAKGNIHAHNHNYSGLGSRMSVRAGTCFAGLTLLRAAFQFTFCHMF